ncbi:MAG: hypothetical protein AAF558_12035, partial [Verrucomicrobiota bacterium]
MSKPTRKTSSKAAAEKKVQPPSLEGKSDTTPSPRKSSKGLWIGIAGGLVVLICVFGLLLLVAGGFAAYFLRPQLAEGDFELKGREQVRQDYAEWLESRRAFAESLKQDEEAVFGSLPDGGKPVGILDKWTQLPGSVAAEKSLKERIGSQFQLLDLQPVQYTKEKDQLSITYLATLKSRYEVSWVQVDEVDLEGLGSKEKDLAPLLVLSSDLPAGQAYDTANAQSAIAKNAKLDFYWTVDEYEKQKDGWVLVGADPFPIQQGKEWERQILTDTSQSSRTVLRTSADLAQEQQIQEQALRSFTERIATIESESAAYHQQVMSAVGGAPSRSSSKFGGSGSGEPTKSVARVGGGAGTGAAIGAIAGGGVGAGWGAFAGAGAGAIY